MKLGVFSKDENQTVFVVTQWYGDVPDVNDAIRVKRNIGVPEGAEPDTISGRVVGKTFTINEDGTQSVGLDIKK